MRNIWRRGEEKGGAGLPPAPVFFKGIFLVGCRPHPRGATGPAPLYDSGQSPKGATSPAPLYDFRQSPKGATSPAPLYDFRQSPKGAGGPSGRSRMRDRKAMAL
ncbi:hypothetical protein GCM10027256_34000 [Novispirillum itersonii subsp. nipponicum]